MYKKAKADSNREAKQRMLKKYEKYIATDPEAPLIPRSVPDGLIITESAIVRENYFIKQQQAAV